MSTSSSMAAGKVSGLRVTPLREILGIDLRSLALFRAGLALCILFDLFVRAGELTDLQSDAGVLPRRGVLEFWDWRVLNSLHLASGSYWWQLFLWAVAAGAALCLLVGYRSRLMAVVSLLLLVSVQARTYATVQGSDDLLRVLLFWGCFLPLGARASIDAAMADGLRPDSHLTQPPDHRLVFGFASVALILQAMAVYFVGALLKTSPIWFPDGNAVYYALSIDQFTTPLAKLVLELPVGLLQAITYFVWFLELVGPFFLFLPVFHLSFRLTVLAMIVAMHVGFLLLLEVGLFPYCSLLSLVPLIPGAVWDALGRRFATAEREKLSIHYDRGCGFCRKTCLLLRSLLLLPRIPIRPAQEDKELGRVLERENSWIVRDEGGALHLKWDALTLLLRRSPLWAPLGWLLARPLFDAPGRRFYDLIGRSRRPLGTVTERLLPYRPVPVQPGLLNQALAAALLLFVAFINFDSLPSQKGILPGWLRDTMLITRLEQRWGMFAPHPLILDGYYVIPGTLGDGTKVDVFRGTLGEPGFEKPDDVAGTYRNQRWRKYLVNLTGEQYAPLRRWYAGWLCREWNDGSRAGAPLKSFEIYFVIEPTPPPGGTREGEIRPLWQHRCY